MDTFTSPSKMETRSQSTPGFLKGTVQYLSPEQRP